MILLSHHKLHIVEQWEENKCWEFQFRSELIIGGTVAVTHWEDDYLKHGGRLPGFWMVAS